MSAGTLRATISLDEPGRIHRGSSDPVTGNVILRFTPSMSSREQHVSEFFGPLKVSITLHGRLKTKIRAKRGNSSTTYRGRVPLLNRTVKLYDDSAKIAAGEAWPIPFDVSFPDNIESRILDEWEGDMKYDSRQEQPLPPTFSKKHTGFSRDFESFIEYRVGVGIHVPHLPINIVKPEKETEPVVQYGQASLPQELQPKHHKYKRTISISNELLLPEDDRPSGFRQKAKAAFSSDFYPHYNFDWTLVAPQHIHLGQPIPFEVRIRTREAECTAVVVPEVRLHSLTVLLTSHTAVRAEKNILSHPESDHDDNLHLLPGVPDDARPFSKANDFGKIVNTTSVPENTECSFRTVNISLTHSMEIRLAFEAQGKVYRYDPRLTVTILSPPLNAGTPADPSTSNAIAGNSSQPGRSQQIGETLPRYEEGLPQYEEVIGDGPEPLPKDRSRANGEAA